VGVCWDKSKRKWQAKIRHDRKQQRLGSFDDEREVARAVDTAARRLRGTVGLRSKCSPSCPKLATEGVVLLCAKRASVFKKSHLNHIRWPR
jgi:hypothetical protein